MQKKRKNLWISIVCICAILLVATILTHFVFRLKTVDVEFQSRLSESETNLEEGIQDKVKGYYESKENIILMNFDETTKIVEKENPYLKVNSIIKVFPNTIRVYISERIPKFKVKNSNNNSEWLILDEDFKIVTKITESNETNVDLANYIEISNENLNISLEIGEFVMSNYDCKNFVNQIAVGVYGVSEDYSIVKTVSYEEKDGDFEFYIYMKNVANEDETGCTIIIKGADDLTNKAFAGIKTFEESLSDGSLVNDSSSTITIFNDDGRLVAIKN